MSSREINVKCGALESRQKSAGLSVFLGRQAIRLQIALEDRTIEYRPSPMPGGLFVAESQTQQRAF